MAGFNSKYFKEFWFVSQNQFHLQVFTWNWVKWIYIQSPKYVNNFLRLHSKMWLFSELNINNIGDRRFIYPGRFVKNIHHHRQKKTYSDSIILLHQI